jgi:hypothetical protein
MNNLNNPSVPTDNPPTAPWMFEMIGWSWLVLSAAGLLFNLVSLALLPTEDTVKKILAPLVQLSPSDLSHIRILLTWAMPLTGLQVLGSVLATWASWAFLQRKNWGRLVLAVMNWMVTAVVALMMAGAFILVRQLRFVSLEDLSAAGLGSGFLIFMNIFIFVSTLILLAPLGWMGWYFHSFKVRRYFETK